MDLINIEALAEALIARLKRHLQPQPASSARAMTERSNQYQDWR
jgi:hypothetical protein